MTAQLEHILGLIETLEDAVKGAMIDPSPPETALYDFGRRCADWFVKHQTETISLELWGDFKNKVLYGEEKA